MKKVLSIVVRNQPGVLMRVAGMFSRRGFNIDSLAVGMTQNKKFSRMTVTVDNDDATVEQIMKQLVKLVEVEDVRLLPDETKMSRGMALVKVAAGSNRMEILKLAEVFRVSVIDIGAEAVIFEVTGVERKIKAFVDIMAPYGILEMVQTGVIALERGDKCMSFGKASRYNWPDEDVGENTCMVI
ncbi:MAG: acetolactate synthase small subunit [Acidaminococcales bacterium]|nr:acetolactate synthase small subunit [Acidaminococcales bacterium]